MKKKKGRSRDLKKSISFRRKKDEATGSWESPEEDWRRRGSHTCELRVFESFIESKTKLN